VLDGDSYLPIEDHGVAGTFARCGNPALMTVSPHHDRLEKSEGAYADSSSCLCTKDWSAPADLTHVDDGFSVLTRETGGEYAEADVARDRADALRTLRFDGRLAGCAAPHRFVGIASAAGITALGAYLSSPTGRGLRGSEGG
jgi:hypothetical protein